MFYTCYNGGKFTFKSRESFVLLTLMFSQCTIIRKISTVSFLWKTTRSENIPLLETEKSLFELLLLGWPSLFFWDCFIICGYLIYWLYIILVSVLLFIIAYVLETEFICGSRGKVTCGDFNFYELNLLLEKRHLHIS